jgi:hypothetical protein
MARLGERPRAAGVLLLSRLVGKLDHVCAAGLRTRDGQMTGPPFQRVTLFRLHICSYRNAAVVNLCVSAIDPAEFLQPLQQCAKDSFTLRIVGSYTEQYANAPQALNLLRMRYKRPCGSQDDKIASSHCSTIGKAPWQLNKLLSPL